MSNRLWMQLTNQKTEIRHFQCQFSNSLSQEAHLAMLLKPNYMDRIERTTTRRQWSFARNQSSVLLQGPREGDLNKWRVRSSGSMTAHAGLNEDGTFATPTRHEGFVNMSSCNSEMSTENRARRERLLVKHRPDCFSKTLGEGSSRRRIIDQSDSSLQKTRSLFLHHR
jgi:hypothetical protein